MLKSLFPVALCASLIVVLGTGCTPECQDNLDCRGRGDFVCSDNKCVPNTTGECVPACSGATPVCDHEARACKACTATEGCSGTAPVCDLSAGGGAGACATCTLTQGCAPGSATPVCDITVAGGRCVACTSNANCSGATPACDTSSHTCVTCTATAGCGAGTVCDTSVAGGQCVGCLASSDCASGVCDTTAKVCKTCLGGGMGCSGATPVCNTAANGGNGACVTCLPAAVGSVAPGCSAATPACDTSVTGGRCVACNATADCASGVCDVAAHVCKTCLADNSGCSGATPVCNTSAGGGSGACVTCLAGAPGTTAPGCSASAPACDTTVAGGRCVACNATADCASGVCDPSAHVCKTCLADNSGCSGATPVCDATAGGGNGVCVTCLASAPGTTAPGCSAATPACDTSVAGGRCVACNATADCGSGVCDVAGHVCKTCLADNSGCGGSTPVCNTTGNGGLGQCVQCLSGAQCSFDPNLTLCDSTAHVCRHCLANDSGCGGATPVCDTAGDSGNGVCSVCTASRGCSGSTPTCDVSVPGGACVGCTTEPPVPACPPLVPHCDVPSNSCVECLSSSHCTAGTRNQCDTSVHVCRTCLVDNTGCSGTTPVCNTAGDSGNGACVTCLAAAPGTVAPGCSASVPACDTSVAGGRCVACNTTADCASGVCDAAAHVCKTCLADNTGCGGSMPVCDVAGNGGSGICRACLADNRGCSGTTPVCDVAGGGGSGVCRTCLADNSGCGGTTPVCDVAGGGGSGVCRTCLADNTGCSGTTPLCDVAGNGGSGACRTCLANNTGCSGTTPYCEVSGGGGSGACEVCTATAGCSAPTPICLTSATPRSCVQCVNNGQCAATEECDPGTHACVPPATPPATTSLQIAAVRATPDGTGLNLLINGALVTYKRVTIGTDVAGFFLQAEQNGPAIFVAVDPAMVVPVPLVGDRVNLTVNAVATVGSLKQVTAMSGFTVVSSGHPISGIVQDVTAAADLVSGLNNYESEAIRINNATVAAAFAAAGTGFSSAQINTTGVTGNANLKLRIPDSLKNSLDLAQGCVVTLNYGVMWRFNTQAQPSAYGSELSVISCPAPVVSSAAASDLTHVVLTFSRQIAPASVNPNGSQFTFDNGLTATAASVSGNQVTVTTSAQTARTNYTVTVANTVTDTRGTVLGTPNSATFLGYVVPAVLMINEINPNLTNDLVELRVLSAGSTLNMTLVLDITTPTLLATFPDVSVATGDIIVVHMRPNVAPPNTLAPTSETTAKDQHPAATFTANYDSAWDLLGNNTTMTGGITYSSRTLLVKTASGATQDAVPCFNTGAAPGNWPTDVMALQAAGQWLPPDCGGVPCNTALLANSVSVDWILLGSTAAGASVYRQLDADTNRKEDWIKGTMTGAQLSSFGLPNFGQTP